MPRKSRGPGSGRHWVSLKAEEDMEAIKKSLQSTLGRKAGKAGIGLTSPDFHAVRLVRCKGALTGFRLP